MDLEAALKKKTFVKNQCRVNTLIASLDDKNRKALESAINSNLSPYVISRAVKSEGLTLSENTIYKHRRNECLCETK
jgi:hypothetical protein